MFISIIDLEFTGYYFDFELREAGEIWYTTSKTTNFRKTVSLPSTLDAGRRRSDLTNAAAIALHSESLNDSPQMNYRLYSDPFLIHFATVIKHNILIHLCAFYIISLISIAKIFAFVYN